MSSDKQAESPEQQREAIAKLAAKHGFKIIREYYDAGISGDATEKRHAFQSMIADAAKGGFKAILCWDQSRFGRFHSIESGFYVFPLMQAGVELFTVAEGRIAWDDFTGRLMHTINAEAKHGFLRDLSRNVYRGQSAAARRGEWLGLPPLGYQIENKRLVIDEAEAVVVRRIFALCVGGLSLRGIAEKLNADPSTSKTWTFSTVAKVLRNVAYAGVYRWGFRSESKYADPAEHAEPVEIPNNHPAIVSPETFATAQRLLGERKRKSTPHRNGGNFVLTGLVNCACCGSPMTGKAPRVGKTCYEIFYICSGYSHRGASFCRPYRVFQDEVLNAVLGTIEKQFLDAKNLDRLKVELRKQVESQVDPKLGDRLRKQVVTVDAQLAKATRRLIECETDMLPAVQNAVRELRAERDQLAASLKAAETPRKRLHAAADDRIKLAVDAVSKLRQTLKSDPLKLRELLREAVERVDVKAEKIPEGKRSYWRLASGTIHLRGGFVSNLCTASARWARR